MKRSAKTLARKTILVVEDDKQIASALYVRLQASGYDVVTANDGFKGLAAAMGSHPNLIVMDIWLPGAIGFVVAERLKDVGLGSVPIIFTTASKKEGFWRLAQEVGSVAFFEKPYDTEELLAAIARALDDDSINTCASLLLKCSPKRNSNEKNSHR
jgi:DNA-binding response OmpR family regulator